MLRNSYIEENHEYKLKSRASQRSQPAQRGGFSQDMMSFWGTLNFLHKVLFTLMLSGYKFETLSLIPDIWDSTPREYIENREKMVVDNHAQYCSIVKTGIGSTKMILGGEVDAGKTQQRSDVLY